MLTLCATVTPCISRSSRHLALQALHARVLKLYGEFLGSQGRTNDAAEMAKETARLEATYGFSTQ